MKALKCSKGNLWLLIWLTVIDMINSFCAAESNAQIRHIPSGGLREIQRSCQTGLFTASKKVRSRFQVCSPGNSQCEYDTIAYQHFG